MQINQLGKKPQHFSHHNEYKCSLKEVSHKMKDGEMCADSMLTAVKVWQSALKLLSLELFYCSWE